MRETQVRSLGWEDPLEEEMATHSNILTWSLLGDKYMDKYRGAWYAIVHGVSKSWTRLSDFTLLSFMGHHRYLVQKVINLLQPALESFIFVVKN